MAECLPDGAVKIDPQGECCSRKQHFSPLYHRFVCGSPEDPHFISSGVHRNVDPWNRRCVGEGEVVADPRNCCSTYAHKEVIGRPRAWLYRCASAVHSSHGCIPDQEAIDRPLPCCSGRQWVNWFDKTPYCGIPPSQISTGTDLKEASPTVSPKRWWFALILTIILLFFWRNRG